MNVQAEEDFKQLGAPSTEAVDMSLIDQDAKPAF
jgi:hypothetical protein